MASFEVLYDEKRRPFLISVAVHLLFFLLAAMWQIGFIFKPAEFVELSLASGSYGGSQPTWPSQSATLLKSTPSPSRRSPDQVVAPTTVPPKPAIKATPQVDRTPSHPVLPPKRRMLEEEEPQLSTRTEGKLTPDLASQESRFPSPTPASAGETTTKYDDALGEGNISSSATSGSTGNQNGDASTEGDQPYTIEGDAAQRSILHQVIPTYPSGLQKEEVLRIRFTVLADGSIGLMIPMRKGDPTLEKITLDALRQWRFSPLPASAEQKNVTGIISFRYELQ